MTNKELIDKLVESKTLKTKRIISAFRKVDRINFCDENYKKYAYQDTPLPIPGEQTISQPTTVAMMTEAIQPKKVDKILEIGAGSGYQAAILAEIVNPGKVYTIERINELFNFAKNNLASYKNVEVVHGDGSIGLKEKAPFDCIIVTACAPNIPDNLKQQLKIGGKLIIPVGQQGAVQKMMLVTRTKSGFKTEDLGHFVFVPLVGKFGF